MTSIYPDEKQVHDLIDEVFRDDYEMPFAESVLRLRILRLMITSAIEKTEHYPPKDFSNTFIGIQDEVERLLGIIDDLAFPYSNDDNEEVEVSESLSEMADNLEGWFEELDDIDASELSASQLEDIESIFEALIEYQFRVIDVLKGIDLSNELGEK